MTQYITLENLFGSITTQYSEAVSIAERFATSYSALYTLTKVTRTAETKVATIHIQDDVIEVVCHDEDGSKAGEKIFIGKTFKDLYKFIDNHLYYLGLITYEQKFENGVLQQTEFIVNDEIMIDFEPSKIEKRYDAGFMEVETLSEFEYDLWYDSAKFAHVTILDEGVYRIVAFKSVSCIAERVLLQPTEDEFINHLDELLTWTER